MAISATPFSTLSKSALKNDDSCVERALHCFSACSAGSRSSKPIVATSLLAVALVALAQFVGAGVQSGAAARARARHDADGRAEDGADTRACRGLRSPSCPRTSLTISTRRATSDVPGASDAVRRRGVCQALVGDAGGLLDRRAHHRSRRASRRERAWQHDARDRQSAG